MNELKIKKYLARHNTSVVFITGTYDILHVGHLKMFEFAKSKFPNSCLVIAIDSDLKVKKDKGDSRPYNIQEDRKFFLKRIKDIEYVFIFNSEEELIELLKEIKPDVRIVGSDWMDKKIVGEEHCGRVIYFERIPGYSTTEILNYEKSRY